MAATAIMHSRDWVAVAERYARPEPRRSVRQLAATVGLFVALHATMFATVATLYVATLALSIVTACVMVRAFSIQHDCQHGAFFASRRANDLVGRMLCLVTLVPNGHHRRLHAVHHAVTGRLDRRRTAPESFPRTAADFDLITVAEFQALPRRQRVLYRFLRHPAVIFTVVPCYLFLFSYRFPVLHPTSRWRGWISTQVTNAAIAAAILAVIELTGLRRFALVFGPTMVAYTVIGVWLFYVQHQFEHTYWRTGTGWDYRDASLHGSSHLALPRVLAWLTGNIGIHHLHHLCPRIPNYRLADCVREHPELAAINRIGMRDSFRMLRMSLWDEDQRKLIRFSELRG